MGTPTDVRPAAKEQVESLGAKFVAVEDEEFKQAETAGGYAKEMSEEYKQKQAALIQEHARQADVVITNPTHLAIALRFDADNMVAPRVVAKGADHIAARIREIAAGEMIK